MSWHAAGTTSRSIDSQNLTKPQTTPGMWVAWPLGEVELSRDRPIDNEMGLPGAVDSRDPRRGLLLSRFWSIRTGPYACPNATRSPGATPPTVRGKPHQADMAAGRSDDKAARRTPAPPSTFLAGKTAVCTASVTQAILYSGPSLVKLFGCTAATASGEE